MKTLQVLLLVGISWSTYVLAQPWSLADCGPEGGRGWSQFEKSVRTAIPGSTVYAPKPYPQSDRDVIEDFLYHYKDVYGKGSSQRALGEAIFGQKAAFSVLRVENWTTLRYGKERKRDFYFMVRIYDAGSGTDLARAVLNDSGLMSVLNNYTNSPPLANKGERQKMLIPGAQQMLQEVTTRFKVAGDSPEYVMAFGTVSCDFTRPCLAFHGGETYLYSRLQDELFHISARARRLTQGKDVGTLETNARLQKDLPADERFVSLGGDSWAVATLVPAP